MSKSNKPVDIFSLGKPKVISLLEKRFSKGIVPHIRENDQFEIDSQAIFSPEDLRQVLQDVLGPNYDVELKTMGEIIEANKEVALSIIKKNE